MVGGEANGCATTSFARLLARNLSQQTVGKAIGLSDSQVSLIERGGHPDVAFVTVAQMLGAVGL